MFKYIEADWREVTERIAENIDISYDDTEIIDEILKEYEIFKYKKQDGKNALYRLTAPLFIIFVMLATVLVLFPNWIFTGSFGFDHKNILGDFIRKWERAIWG